MSEDDDRGWKFELDDLSEDEDESAVSEAIERESVDPENAAFVAAGVLLTVGTIVLLAL